MGAFKATGRHLDYSLTSISEHKSFSLVHPVRSRLVRLVGRRGRVRVAVGSAVMPDSEE